MRHVFVDSYLTIIPW